MIARLSVVMVKLDPSLTLKETEVSSPFGFDFFISFPSSRTLTSPTVLQFANVNLALPFPQNVVEIAEFDHP